MYSESSVGSAASAASAQDSSNEQPCHERPELKSQNRFYVGHSAIAKKITEISKVKILIPQVTDLFAQLACTRML